MPRGGCSKCKGEEYKFLITQTLSFICCQSFVPTPWGGVVEHFGRSTYKWWRRFWGCVFTTTEATTYTSAGESRLGNDTVVKDASKRSQQVLSHSATLVSLTVHGFDTTSAIDAND